MLWQRLASFLAAGCALAATADPNYRQLRDAQPAETYSVKDLVLQRDVGTITLRSGTITFIPPVLGKVTKAVFIGDGEFAFKPAFWMETNYLKRLTSKETIEESFRQLVLCFTDGTYDEIRRSATAAAVEPRARESLRDFHNHIRQRPDLPKSQLEEMLASSPTDNVEAEILADLYNPKRPGFFSAYITGRQHGHLRFFVKPRGALAFLPSPEEVAVINWDPQGAQEGIWYLAHYATEIAKHIASSQEDKRIVSAQKYRIETTVGKNDHLTAVADFEFRAVTDGDRVVDLDLLPALRVTRVTSDKEHEVSFIQEERKADGSLHVILSEPMVKGRDYRLVVEYSGDRCHSQIGRRQFQCRSPHKLVSQCERIFGSRALRPHLQSSQKLHAGQRRQAR